MPMDTQQGTGMPRPSLNDLTPAMREYLRIRSADRHWDKVYRLHVQLPNNRKFRVTCYGSDQPQDVLARLHRAGVLDEFYIPNLVIMNWQNIRFQDYPMKEDMWLRYEPTHLCDMNPEEGYCLYVEDRSSTCKETVCLYGCPTADGLGYEDLPECTAEVVDYE